MLPTLATFNIFWASNSRWRIWASLTTFLDLKYLLIHMVTVSQAKYAFDLLSQARLTDSKIDDSPLCHKLRATYGKLIPYPTLYR